MKRNENAALDLGPWKKLNDIKYSLWEARGLLPALEAVHESLDLPLFDKDAIEALTIIIYRSVAQSENTLIAMTGLVPGCVEDEEEDALEGDGIWAMQARPTVRGAL